MLEHLHIQHYALINQLDIDFSDGFSVLTGETGAGKSIILGALGLIMGERAEQKSIMEGEQKCVVEATFSLSADRQDEWRVFFQGNDLDYDDYCIIRREVSINGKSRAFINDTPVSLNVIKDLSSRLIDIHSQHENLLLRSDAFQLQIVDAVAQNKEERNTYITAYQSYKHTEQQLIELQDKKTRLQADADYIDYQYTQLHQAQLKENEEEELNEELQLLSHAEEIKTALNNSYRLLQGEETGAEGVIKEAVGMLKKIENYLPTGEANLLHRLQSVHIELKDIAEEAFTQAEHIEFSTERLQQAEERLDQLNTLMQKHHCQSTAELIALRDHYGKQLQENDDFEEEIALLQKELEEKKSILKKNAETLSQSRKKVTETVAHKLESQLLLLGIPHAKMEVQMRLLSDYTPTGIDEATFMFAANKNQQLRPVTEVASGGEMARIMLCIKTLTADERGLSTIIFDEVDTGVSGEIANNMGSLMQQIATNRQIIAITHLPQIAALGKTHYKVFKQDNDFRTETQIRLLKAEERINEIATLLSGENVTKAALLNAKELLKI